MNWTVKDTGFWVVFFCVTFVTWSMIRELYDRTEKPNPQSKLSIDERIHRIVMHEQAREMRQRAEYRKLVESKQKRPLSGSLRYRFEAAIGAYQLFVDGRWLTVHWRDSRPGYVKAYRLWHNARQSEEIDVELPVLLAGDEGVVSVEDPE